MHITKRETELLQHLANGRMCKQIAIDLNISERTVQAHLANIRRRNRIKTVTQMVADALRQGSIK